MNFRKIILLTIFISTLACFIATAEQLSEYEATKIGTTYTFEGEMCESYGPYEYDNHPYYVCSIYDDDILKSEIVIDANSGEVVTEESLAKAIIKNDLILTVLHTEDNYHLNMDYAETYRENIEIFDSDIDFWIQIRDSASNPAQKENAQEAADLSQDIKSEYENLLDMTENLIQVQTKIKAGGTFEDAENLYEAEKESYHAEKQFVTTMNVAINKTPEIYDNVLNSNYRYGTSENEWKQYKSGLVNFYKGERDSSRSNMAYWESMSSTLDTDTQWIYESMMDRVQEVEAVSAANTLPGFTLLIASFALLISGIFIKRMK